MGSMMTSLMLPGIKASYLTAEMRVKLIQVISRFTGEKGTQHCSLGSAGSQTIAKFLLVLHSHINLWRYQSMHQGLGKHSMLY